MNQPNYFEIQASNPEQVLDFYTEVFGWKFERQPDIPIPYWAITTESITGGLLQRPVKVPPNEYGTNAYVISMQVENFDKTAEIIMRLDGRVAMAKFAIPGKCWQGYFIDPDNNTFGIFEVDSEAS